VTALRILFPLNAVVAVKPRIVDVSTFPDTSTRAMTRGFVLEELLAILPPVGLVVPGVAA
jgi:hypothetical protein